jgi:hypothetical protein
MTAQYEQLLEALHSQGIYGRMYRDDQLALPIRVWLSWKDHWYISTWMPACYLIPDDVDIVALCKECMSSGSRSFHLIPEDIVYRFRLVMISDEEFDHLFPELPED